MYLQIFLNVHDAIRLAHEAIPVVDDANHVACEGGNLHFEQYCTFVL